MPKAKQQKVWLYFTEEADSSNAMGSKCLRAFACKGGNTSNVMRHLTKHRVQFTFDSLRDPVLSTSACISGDPGPGSVQTTCNDDGAGSVSTG